MKKKTNIGERFNPEKYGMVFCPDCNGSGKFFNHAKEVNVCDVCKGFGLIKKEGKNSVYDNRMAVQWIR